MNKNEVIVYWGMLTQPDRQNLVNLIWSPPAPLITTLPSGHSNRVEGNYRACTAFKELNKNIFVVKNAFDAKVKMSGDFENPSFEGEDIWIPRAAGLKNRYSVDYDIRWGFFCEEPLEMRVGPPYFHNTSDRSSAHIAVGQFNIGKWFRGANPCYILWEGQDELTLKKDEPMLYFEFMTDKKVILKQYDATADIVNMANEVGNITNYVKLEPLSELYERFFKTNRRAKILKLIKDNLLE
jgi:hypothetical protein